MRVILILILFFHIVPVWSIQNNPQTALKKYLDLVESSKIVQRGDLHYQYEVYDELSELVTFKVIEMDKLEGPSYFLAYTNYDVTNTKLDEKNAEFELTYNIIGSVIGGSHFEPWLSYRKKIIKLKLINSKWQIYHVSGGIRHSHFVHISKINNHYINIAERIEDRSSDYSKHITVDRKIIKELVSLNPLTIYDAELSYKTILALLFSDKNFVLKKGTTKFTENFNKYSRDQLRKLRNVIYAKHQFIFKDKKLIDYYKYVFSSNLYTPHKESINLTGNDKENIKFIKEAERRVK